MKSRSEIWLSALEDFGARCSVNTAKTAENAVRRVEHEGDSFFTVTLPTFAKDLERSLAKGGISSDLFSRFSRSTLAVRVTEDGLGEKIKKFSHAGLPAFLSEFLEIVFDTDVEMTWSVYNAYSGANVHPLPVVRACQSEPEYAQMAFAIYAVRQLCLMFSKEKSLCDDLAVEKAFDSYVKLDESLIDPFLTVEESTFSKVDDSTKSEES